MDKTTQHIRDLLESSEYLESAKKANELKERIAGSNRFQIDGVYGEAKEFFSKLQAERPEIYPILAVTEKEIVEVVVRIKTGKKIVVD